MAANQGQAVSIWNQMSYIPPRGACAYKTSVLSSCACYRFMIHPLKAATSFDCDGCGHHASFHRMENPLEKQIIQNWTAEETARRRDPASLIESAGKGDVEEIRMRKVRRIDYGRVEGQENMDGNSAEVPHVVTTATRKRARGK